MDRKKEENHEKNKSHNFPAYWIDDHVPVRNSVRLEYYFQIDFRDIPVLECADAFHDLYTDNAGMRRRFP